MTFLDFDDFSFDLFEPSPDKGEKHSILEICLAIISGCNTSGYDNALPANELLAFDLSTAGFYPILANESMILREDGFFI